MNKIIPWLVYAVSVFVSRKFCEGYWVVGPVFGAAVILAHFEAVRKKVSPNHLLFVAASTLIYALVFWISDKGWKFQQEWLDSLAGSLSAGVVVGSLLLPFVHAILLGGDSKTVQSVSVSLIGSWYAVVFLTWLDEIFHISFRMDYLFIAIALWQGLYLYRLPLK